MDTLNPNIPTPELARLMTAAAAKMKAYHLNYLTPQLLLRTFLDDPKCAAYRILQQLEQERDFKLEGLTRRVEDAAHHNKGRDAKFDFTNDFGEDVRLADELLVVLDEGLTIAQSRDELKVHSGHALAAMARPNVTTYGFLQRLGITETAVIALLETVAQNGSVIIRDYVDEAKKGNAPAYFERLDYLRDLLSFLALAQKRHIILVGPEGAGKRTLVYSLAERLAEGNNLDLRSVVEMDETALLENPLKAMRAGLRRASGGILLVPRIERFFADRLRAKFPENVSRELHKAILNNDQIIIGTTTPGRFDQLNANDLIRENMNKLDVKPATRDEAISILTMHLGHIEQEYEIVVQRPALETAVELASQYLKTMVLPASALKLTHQGCAMVSAVLTSSDIVYPGIVPDGHLDAEDVMVAAAHLTNIPVTKLTEDEKGKYANMVEHLHKRLIGQNDAVDAVGRAVKTARVGLRDKKRPIGSFLFLGPSGVGKTELAKALAEFMFGSEEAMLVLDMSEYQEEASVNKLIGAPPGYVGFQGGGRLTNFVRERPYTVVLFDEVEKAHQRVFDVLLQVLEEGRLTDSQGQVATFNEAVIIMTSNLGSKHMLVPVIGDVERELVMGNVHTFFRPEFLNRIDEIVLFHQLTGEQLAKILDLILNKEIKLAKEQGLELALTPAAKQWLLDQNDEPQYGARPLRRIIARHLREPLADYLLSQEREKKTAVVVIDAGEAGLKFEMA